MRKKSRFQMILLKIRIAIMSGQRRTKFFERNEIFADFGENCFYCSRTIPEEPYMVKIHNNVVISANVNFITHDIINDMLSRKEGVALGTQLSEYYMGTIEIYDNVAIGSDVTIMYGIKIGPNAVIAAGSVVTKDVPEGTIVGGNPAKVIGSVDKLIEKRKRLKDVPSNRDSLDKILSYYWGEKTHD